MWKQEVVTMGPDPVVLGTLVLGMAVLVLAAVAGAVRDHRLGRRHLPLDLTQAQRIRSLIMAAYFVHTQDSTD